MLWLEMSNDVENKSGSNFKWKIQRKKSSSTIVANVSVFVFGVNWSYLLYVDGETALSGGCLFTFGLTLLTCLMEFTCILTDCCCCGPVCCGCCCALSCCDEPVIPPFDRRFRLITAITMQMQNVFSQLNKTITCLSEG